MTNPSEVAPPHRLHAGMQNIWVYPPLTDPDFLHRTGLRDKIKQFAEMVPAGSTILDVGCGWMPYKAWFDSKAARYIPSDVTPYPDPRFRLIENGRLPAPDHSIDVVLCWQVLEHVAELAPFFDELRRVMKPGATACFTTHGLFRIHDVEDFWRWTPAGLDRLLLDNSFSMCSIESCDSTFSIIALLTNNMIVKAFQSRHRNRDRLVFRPIRRLFAAGVNVLALCLDCIGSAIGGAVHRAEVSTYFIKAKLLSQQAEVPAIPAKIPATSPEKTFISVAICTRNRASDLPRLFKSLADLEYPADRFEVLVVDNGSQDATREVAEAWLSRLPNIRYFYEGQPGLPYARNTAWKNARGDLIAYIDDDAKASPGWLTALGSAFARYRDDFPILAVGGPVRLAWDAPFSFPGWWPKHFNSWLSELDFGPDCFILDKNSLCLVGANFAITKTALNAIGGFCEGGLSYGDERYVEAMIRSTGGALVYTGDAHITHHVSPSRVDRKWLRKRFFTEGVSVSKLRFALHGRNLKSLAFLVNRSLKSSIDGSIGTVQFMFAPSPERFARSLSLYYSVGVMLGIAR